MRSVKKRVAPTTWEMLYLGQTVSVKGNPMVAGTITHLYPQSHIAAVRFDKLTQLELGGPLTWTHGFIPSELILLS